MRSEFVAAPDAGGGGAPAAPLLFLSHAGADTEAARELDAAPRGGAGRARGRAAGLVRQGRPARRAAAWQRQLEEAIEKRVHRLRGLHGLHGRGELGRGRGAPRAVARRPADGRLPLRPDPHRRGAAAPRCPASRGSSMRVRDVENDDPEFSRSCSRPCCGRRRRGRARLVRRRSPSSACALSTRSAATSSSGASSETEELVERLRRTNGC